MCTAEEDAEAAAKLLVEICDRYQHPSAQLSLAKCFVMGLGVEADESMGLKLCLLALGDAEKVCTSVHLKASYTSSLRPPTLVAVWIREYGSQMVSAGSG